jgi:hypothetical protein
MTVISPEQRLFPRMPGMVSYTYRNDFAKDLGTTLDEIKQLGITDMEFSSTFGHPASASARNWTTAACSAPRTGSGTSTCRTA